MEKFVYLVVVGCIASFFACADARAQTRVGPSTAEIMARAKKCPKMSVNDIPGLHVASDWPTNFPVRSYSSNVVFKTFENSTKGSPTAAANIVTKDAPGVAYAWYVDWFKSDGWAIRTGNPAALAKFSKFGPLYKIEAKKPKQEVLLFCSPDKKTKGTSIQIGWTKTKH